MMGTAAKRRDKFIKAHPVCCFCGGTAPTQTEDHWPPRSLFRNRAWPEGFVFPACVRCNSVSRLDEPLVSLVCRVRPDEPAETDEGWGKLLKGLGQTHPEVLKSMAPSANEVKAFLRKRNIELPPGHSTQDVPLMSLRHPEIHEAVSRFAFKLFASLYYKHSGKCLPHEGGVQFIWRTNVQRTDDMESPNVTESLSHAPRLVRRAIALDGQFSYRYGITADEEVPSGLFLVRFNRSITMLGFVYGDAAKFQEIDDRPLMHPFKWEEQ